MAEDHGDRFRRACGATGPLQLILERQGGEPVAMPTFPQPYVVIGRDERADLRLDDPEVSRRHAYLQLIGGRLFGIDLQSRTGTHWNDGPRSMGWVGLADWLRIGQFRFAALGGEPTTASQTTGSSLADLAWPTSRAFEVPGLIEASLEVLDPSVARTTWRITRALILLGRTRPCWVRLPNRDVSRIHASLVRTPEGIWVVDLLSRIGVLVNGERTLCARLDDGDELQIGPHRIRLRCRNSAAAVRAVWPLALSSPSPHLDPGGRPATLAVSSSVTPSLPILDTSTKPEPGRVLTPRVELTDSVLVPLLNELGQMQQQMADQFQQALMMMFQLFSSMHQDQMSLIREELAQIQRLTREQQTLQAELLKHHAREPEPGGEPEPRPALRLVPTTELNDPAGKGFSNDTSSPGPTDSDRSRRAAAGASPQAARKGSASTRPQAGQEDLHAILVQRLSAIQEERQGRWQKLLKSITGRAEGGTSS